MTLTVQQRQRSWPADHRDQRHDQRQNAIHRACRASGCPTSRLPASATTQWGNSRLRVSLVLDNTGSMLAFNKIGALKTAAKNLIGQLQAAATNTGDVYVSIVPFVKDVNARRQQLCRQLDRLDGLGCSQWSLQQFNISFAIELPVAWQGLDSRSQRRGTAASSIAEIAAVRQAADYDTNVVATIDG